MTRQFSLYLDLVRFFAAVLVVISHSNMRYLSTDLIPFSSHGHIAVMFFFVLSGYVIAYVTDLKENTFSLYWSSRLSRIYSVAFVAVLLTPILDIVGSEASSVPEIYSDVPNDYWPIRLFASLFFANEFWFVSIMSFSNTPFWSLCYEMSYYLLFSLMVFIRSSLRWWLFGIVCFLIGPKILLLFPIWLLGVFLHRSEMLASIGVRLGWLLFLGSSSALVAWELFEVTYLISDQLKLIIGAYAHEQLAFSKFFLGDWVIGVLVMANFAGFRAIAPAFSQLLDPFASAIRFLASFTLTLYLLHQPLILFFAALFNGDPGSRVFYWSTMGATFATIFLIGSYTEKKRGAMRLWVRINLERLERNSETLKTVLTKAA